MSTLSKQEILFFKEEGYLVKRDVLDPELMAYARERLWEAAPSQLKRDRLETWIGPFEERCEDKMSYRSGYRWNYRQLGGEPWMIRLLPKNPSVWYMAEQLLGKEMLREPDRVRGIYCTLPYGDVPKKPSGCHVDGHPFHLGVVGYIDDVPPEGGGFMVWPKSHLKFYYDFHSQYRTEPTDQYEKDRACFSQQAGVDCHGRAGDIVFWHHRVGHAAGHNYSCQIRQAVLYDFRKQDIEHTMEESPCQNMWRDWAGVERSS